MQTLSLTQNWRGGNRLSMKTITWFLDLYLFCEEITFIYNSWIYSLKKCIKMIQCKSSFQLKLCHSLNTVSSKTFAVRKIITRGGGPGVTLGSSMTVPLHLPLFRMLSTSVPSISQPLLRSFQVFFQIPKCTIICPFSVARRTTPPRKGKRTLNQF